MARASRPDGPVAVRAEGVWMIVVRINHLSRDAAGTPPDAARLKQCLAPDFYLVIPPGGSATVPAHTAQDVLALSITEAAVGRLTGRAFAIAGAGENRVVADRLVNDLVERLFESGDEPALAESLLRSLLLSLERPPRRSPSRPRQVGGLTARQLGRLREHVETRLGEPLPIAQLAMLVDLSPFHFARAFKRSMGASPARWIRLRRLTVAQKLLADPTRSVGEVAAAVGYDSPSRFAQAFRAVTGQTPVAFRTGRMEVHPAE
ncbi:AraC family transcriptional regulator [Brevundimonas sp.]|uniref:helix-turn-helix transcriptional regulator n=1 Tax=Brevundimonas sp. TaxID=1871086 RepID=UPI00286B52F9|nr:AraC family transcriptional regulator [Brevundimonas sp.]